MQDQHSTLRGTTRMHPNIRLLLPAMINALHAWAAKLTWMTATVAAINSKA
jgi:hypothetical protein